MSSSTVWLKREQIIELTRKQKHHCRTRTHAELHMTKANANAHREIVILILLQAIHAGDRCRNVQEIYEIMNKFKKRTITNNVCVIYCIVQCNDWTILSVIKRNVIQIKTKHTHICNCTNKYVNVYTDSRNETLMKIVSLNKCGNVEWQRNWKILQMYGLKSINIAFKSHAHIVKRYWILITIQ